MQYENAKDILPEALLREIQKYASGKLLYIPSGAVKRAWGEASGYRQQLQRRNRMIRNKYAHGLTISELADEYFLSLDSIKKIIYSKNNGEQLSYSPTVDSAVDYANDGLIEEWIQCYLQLTHKDDSIEDEFMEEKTIYIGVVKFPLRLIHREEQEIENLKGERGLDAPAVDVPAAPPPLLVQYEKGRFHCTLQRELLASLKQRKMNAYPTIIILKESSDYKSFMKHYGNIFRYVDKVSDR